MSKIPLQVLPESQRKIYKWSYHRLTTAHRQVHQYRRHLPTHPDMFPEHDAANAWGIVTLAYSGIEQSMKCLLRMRGKDKGRSHAIRQLFSLLTVEERQLIEKSHRHYCILYPEIPYGTVVEFLRAIDRGWLPWRYFLIDGIEKKTPPTIHPGWMVEIWSSLNDLIKIRLGYNRRTHTVLQRICNAMQSSINHHWNTGDYAESPSELPLTEEDLNQSTSEYRAWRARYPSLFQAYADLLYHDGQKNWNSLCVGPALCKVLKRGIRDFHQRIQDHQDPDFVRFIDMSKRGVLITAMNHSASRE